VLAAIERHGLFPANRNGGGQIVAAGLRDALEKFAAEPPEKTRIVTLQVAGAFHTPYMSPAEQALAAVAGGITPAHPGRLLLSNADGAAVADGHELLSRLVRQVTKPVRWDLCMRSLADLGVTAVIELPPAGTLAGLIKRELKGEHTPEIITLNTPGDLAAARDLISRHGVTLTNEPALHFRVVVASTGGTFEPAADLVEGALIKTGQLIGQIVTRQGNVEITAHQAGHLIEWLAHHDDPVSSGQPLARIGELS
jgi:[acyl-carrier-protein] S-malonyltransferase